MGEVAPAALTAAFSAVLRLTRRSRVRCGARMKTKTAQQLKALTTLLESQTQAAFGGDEGCDKTGR